MTCEEQYGVTMDEVRTRHELHTAFLNATDKLIRAETRVTKLEALAEKARGEYLTFESFYRVKIANHKGNGLA